MHRYKTKLALLLVMIVLCSFIALAVTVDKTGTKFRSKYDETKLKDTFGFSNVKFASSGLVEVEYTNPNDLTSEIGLAFAGDIKVIDKDTIEVHPFRRKKAVFSDIWSPDEQFLASDNKIIIKKDRNSEKFVKDELGDRKRAFFIGSVKTKGGVYQQNKKVIACDSCKSSYCFYCEFDINPEKAWVKVDGTAALMGEEAYQRVYKDESNRERYKFQDAWRKMYFIHTIKDLDRLTIKRAFTHNDPQTNKPYTTPGHLKKIDNLFFNLRFWPYSSSSEIGGIKLKSWGRIRLKIDPYRPSKSSSSRYPFYIFRTSRLDITDIPDDTVLALDLRKSYSGAKIRLYDGGKSERKRILTLKKGKLVFSSNYGVQIPKHPKFYQLLDNYLYLDTIDNKMSGGIGRTAATTGIPSTVVEVVTSSKFKTLGLAGINDKNSKLELVKPYLSKLPLTFSYRGFKETNPWRTYRTNFEVFEKVATQKRQVKCYWKTAIFSGRYCTRGVLS